MKFFYSTATCSTISHIALEEAGVAFTPVEVSWQRNLNVEELAKVTALGAVPTLVLDGGKVLTQTAAILEYAAGFKAGLLDKPGTTGRLETMSWVAFATSDLQRNLGLILGANRMTTQEAAKPEIRDYATKNLLIYLAHIESSLAGKEFIMGQSFTVADAALFTLLGWYKWVEIDTRGFANITAYMKRVYDRPAVQKVLKSENLLEYLQG